MAKKVKSFAGSLQDNPALRFISTTEEAEQQQVAVEKVLGYDAEQQPIQEPQKQEAPANPLKLKSKEELEIRNRRVQLVFKPSVHEQIKAEAKSLGLSVNEFINQLVEKYLEVKGE